MSAKSGDSDDSSNSIVQRENQRLTVPKNDILHEYTDDCKNQNLKHNDKGILSSAEELDQILRSMPLTEDTTCGFWLFKGSFLQRFANKKAYVILYGTAGCILAMTISYFESTITTIEKRFRIPSRNTGIISVGREVSVFLASGALSYYAGKGHRPRWLGFGMFTLLICAMLNVLPHFIYGSGADALKLTTQHGGIFDINATHEPIHILSLDLKGGATCDPEEGSLIPQVLMFIGQFISGIGCSLYHILGTTYMDDNATKLKTPALLSIAYFLRMLGPALGYTISSFCLRMYISPELTPVIANDDPRWLGAWWLGWILIVLILLISTVLLAMFPKELPRAAARKILNKKKQKSLMGGTNEFVQEEESPTLTDMLASFKMLMKNSTLMCNNFSSLFYFFGYMPYWIFTAKYIEVQYRQSAATSNLVTGTVALAFSAIGVLLAGFIITKYKPRARYLAAWNVVVGFLTAAGMISYTFLGCSGNENSMVANISEYKQNTFINTTCNSRCQCDFVKYTPICGEDGNTYISPCHAGCKDQQILPDGEKVYLDCSCVLSTSEIALNLSSKSLKAISSSTAIPQKEKLTYHGRAIPGSCPVDCFQPFVLFLAVMCFLKFIGATGRASNFLVSLRCVPEKDKTVAMGFGVMMLTLLAFIPGPIFFGWILDSFCLVWGKTCSSKGNCWLYDTQALRYNLNTITSSFVLIGTLIDIGVWYFVKDLKIFDEDFKEEELTEFD